jgi:hypothetical protein
VGDEVNALGYDFMFTDMFDAMDQGKEPMETFYDDQHYLIKEEKIPDGTVKLILKEKSTGRIIQKIS